jgi:hypothetical protein
MGAEIFAGDLLDQHAVRGTLGVRGFGATAFVRFAAIEY